MDPSFLIGITSVLQQRQIANNAATRLQAMEDEKQRQADLLLWRRFTITHLIDLADGYARDQSEKPLQTAILTEAHLNRMQRYGIRPEAFEDRAEQERLILLIRKLENIRTHCLHQLTEAEHQSVERAVRAFDLTELIQNTIPMLDAYNANLDYQSMLVRALKRNETMQYLRIAVIIIPTTLFTLISWVLKSIAHPYSGLVMLSSIIVEIILVTVVYILTNRNIDRNIPALRAAIAQTYEQGQVGNDAYWKMIESEFGSFPTREKLNQCLDEQKAIIDAIFPPAAEESCNKYEMDE